jgi:hypothetical protein
MFIRSFGDHTDALLEQLPLLLQYQCERRKTNMRELHGLANRNPFQVERRMDGVRAVHVTSS